MEKKGTKNVPISGIDDKRSIAANLKHYSNETLKVLKEIILPYVKTKQKRFGLQTQPALLIYDVFRGQTTHKSLDVLKITTFRQRRYHQALHMCFNHWI